MSNFVITIDNTSPLITYSSSDWYPGTVNNSLYSLGTYSFSNASGATVSLTFNGTAVWFYGTNGPSNAPCTIQIDSGAPMSLDRTLPSTSFQVQFYQNQNLTPGTHTITLKNEAVDASATFFDLDFVMFQTSNESSGQSSSQVLQAKNSPPYTFDGKGWAPVSNNPELQTAIGMFTQIPGESFNLDFYVSDAVQMFGSLCPSCGQYQVQVDGGSTYTYNASNVINQTAQILFAGSNYGEGTHVLTVTKSDPDGNKALIVDHVETESTTSTATSNDTSSQTQQAVTSTSSPKSAGPSAKVIGGLCAALMVTIFIFGASIFLYRRRRASPSPSSASEKGSLGKIEAFYIDVDDAYRSGSQSRHTHHTHSMATLSTSGIASPSARSSRTLPHEVRSSPRPGSSSRNNRPPNTSNSHNSHNTRNSSSREGPPRRRRTLRNSRILRAGYNLFFAAPGSSISGSNLAPTTVLTTEISERPATTLSSVSEVPQSIPPSNRSSTSRPDSAQRLHVVNLADD